jgi:hypothetical protein
LTAVFSAGSTGSASVAISAVTGISSLGSSMRLVGCAVVRARNSFFKEISCQWGPQSEWGPQAMQLRYHDATSDNLPGGSSRYFEFRAIYTSSERKPRTLHMHAWLLATVRLVRSLLLYPLTSL